MASLISIIKDDLANMYEILSHLFCTFILIVFTSVYFSIINYIVSLIFQEKNILIEFMELASGATILVLFLLYVATSLKIAINKYKE
jgi:hypothetical protein